MRCMHACKRILSNGMLQMKFSLQRRRLHASGAREATYERIHGVRAGDEAPPLRATTLAAQRRTEQITWINVEVSISHSTIPLLLF